MTDPALIPLWTSTGAGGRPEGFSPLVGTTFTFIAKPKPGWNGVVNCELLGRVRTKMLTVGLPAVLADLDDDGTLRPISRAGVP